MELKIYCALILLEKTSPDLYFLIKKAKIETTKREGVTAFCTIEKGQFKIVLGESFIEDFDSYSLAALIEHESLHIVFEHLTRYVYSSLKGQDRLLANIAQDAVINELGEFLTNKTKLNKKMQSGVWFSTVNEFLKANNGPLVSVFTHTSLEVYELLKKHLKPKDKKELAEKAFDEHLKESEETQDLSEVIDLKNSETLKAIEGLFSKGKKAGSSEGKSLLAGIIKAQKDKIFQKQVELFLGQCNTPEKQTTFKRLSRRIENAKGKKAIEKPKVLLGLDTSGSMLTEETIKKMQLIVSKSLALGLELDLIFGDTRKHGLEHGLKKTYDFSNVKGGGGTDLSFIFETFKEKKDYTGLIVVTDAEFDHASISSKKSKTLFVFTEKNEETKKLTKNFRSVYV